MEKKDINIIRILLKDLVNDLSRNKYDAIVKSGRNGNLDVKTIENLIKDYPGSITVPPDDEFNEIDFIEYDNNSEEGEVDFTLWYNNEKSDLTLIAEIFKDSCGRKNIRIYDILVM